MWNAKVYVVVLLLSAVDWSAAYRRGFSKAHCDDMDPTEHNGQPAVGNGTTEEPLPKLELDSDPGHFHIQPPSSRYKRARTMTFSIHGSMTAVLLQVRQHTEDEDTKPVRVGEFKGWPDALQSLQCDEDKNTALTNKDLRRKENISVTWQAPPEDVGDIHLVGSFVEDGMYWLMEESRVLSCDDFPVSLSDCRKAKSCYLHSESSSCHADTCDYVMTYRIKEDNRSVEFVLGGKAEHENCYLGIGFTRDLQVNNMSFISCSKSEDGADVNYYVVEDKDGKPMEQSLPFESTKIEPDGDRLWCTFTLPLTVPGEGGLDLSTPQYHIYLWGHTKGDVPILPRAEKMLISKDEVAIDDLTLTYHLRSGATSQMLSATLVLFLAASQILLSL